MLKPKTEYAQESTFERMQKLFKKNNHNRRENETSQKENGEVSNNDIQNIRSGKEMSVQTEQKLKNKNDKMQEFRWMLKEGQSINKELHAEN